MKKFYLFLIFSICIYTSCNDESVNMEEQEDFVLSESDLNAMLEHELLSNLCYVDVINDSTFNYRLRFGHPDDTDPTILYFKSTYENEALSFFRSLIPIGEEIRLVESGNTITYTIEDVGKLKYSSIGSNDVVAKIEVDFQKIPMIKECIFLPEHAWPYNDVASPFRRGAIYKNKNENRKYLCLKEYTGENNKGIMITFDGGWSTKKIDKVSGVPVDCPSRYVWQLLEDLYTTKKSKFEQAYDKNVIPFHLYWGGSYAVGGETTYRKWYWPYKRHTLTRVFFVKNTGKMQYVDFNWNAPWEELTEYSGILGSYSIEFGSAPIDARVWEVIAY
ncbi:MAG: hypothetical protein E7096_09155 [Bacteroides sp.]|nr:hypothetical protein [Bacteroides sp.]